MVKVSDELRKSRLAARNALLRAGKLPFKEISSAKWVEVEKKWTGMLHVRVEHDTVKGVTPQQFRWWFENSGRKTTWDGVGFEGPEIPMYHLWHHRDHITTSPLSGSKIGFAPGSKVHLREVFNDYQDEIDILAVCEKLDDEEFTFKVKHPTGFTVCRVIHYYSALPEEGGSRFYAETVVGVDIPVIGWFINYFIVPFIYSKKTADHWIRHNVEEVGRSEDIIPVLYQRDLDVAKTESK